MFDTLANLWPVKDENSATEVVSAVLPVQALARDRAVLLVHHLRKSDGAEGTAARGSGALAGLVDIMAELRRLKGAPGGDRRRVLTAYGRPAGVPAEWVVERREDGTYSGRDPDADSGRAERVQQREKKADERKAELRAAIRRLLEEKGTPQTRKELWESLPDELRVNERVFRETLDEGEDDGWRKEGSKGAGGGFVYTPL